MTEALDLPKVEGYAKTIVGFLENYFFTVDRAIEYAVIAAGFLLALVLAPRLNRLLSRTRLDRAPKVFGDGVAILQRLTLPILWLALQWISLVVMRELGYSGDLIRIAVNLLIAWVVVRLISRLIRHTIWSNLIFSLVWVLVALNIVGLLDPLVTGLDSLALNFKTVRISALTIIKGMMALAFMLWAASIASRFLSDRIRHIADLTPSIQILLSKLLQFVLAAVAVMIALGIVGVDLTALTVFSGAVGIGIGLGLQKAASNVVGGIMLLLDKSIRPGDVVAVGESFGWITSLGGRYVSIRTRDGIEHLIPNETFITNGVENWSYSDRKIRLKLPLGISYASDVREVMALCVGAAGDAPRILEDPKPVCLIASFGENAIMLELRVWISDPENGVGNVRSDVLLRVWDSLRLELKISEVTCFVQTLQAVIFILP